MVATPLFQLLRPKLWSHHWLLSFSHHIQSFCKYCHFSLQNTWKFRPLPSTSTVTTLVQILNVSFPDFLNSSPASGPLSSLLKSAREFPPKRSQCITNKCPKPSSGFPLHSEKARVLTVAYKVLHGLALFPLWLFPCCSPNAHIACHEHKSDTFPPQSLCIYCFHHQECSSPDISKAHSLTSFRSSLKYDILFEAFQIIPI